ncbi:MAG: NAD(P)H-hydrate dehydratase [Prevotellaceae bacterium]|jgi:NAD(P)H-hydrate epimerase|nr:NAD(P)H-hydrate dehydratase [Prevotellaceae bacterium]
MQIIDKNFVQSLLLERKKEAHKGDFGHTLLVCGSKGMAGAAVLATQAALRSGCGLVTTHIAENERFILQIKCPSAMISCDKNEFFSEIPQNLEKYSSVGIGCGLGQNPQTQKAFWELLQNFQKPMVIDADALNILAQNPDFQQFIPRNSILTPHLGELRRLAGDWTNEAKLGQNVQFFTQKYGVIMIVKGFQTRIFTPENEIFINSTGNAGMAKGGSGDVLTGLLSGLLARGYEPKNAAIAGVFFHSLAGDCAAEIFGQESMNSSDLIDFICLNRKDTKFSHKKHK